jgi:4-aminobutyrate aminotransferase
MTDLVQRHRAVLPNWMGLYYEHPMEIVSGSGSRVTDSSGRSYLDFFCGILTNMLGYDLPEVRDAVQRQLSTGIVHTSTLYLIRSQVELAEKLARLSGIKYAKVFFTNSGTEANETALMLATTARRSNQVLAMRGSYHGRSFGAVAITGNVGWKSSQLAPFSVQYLHGTDRYLPAFASLSDEKYIEACTADLKHQLTAATARTSGWVSSASTASLSPCTTLNTPSGSPASASSLASSSDAEGSFSDGFRTNVLPQASAIGNIHIGTMAGKLNGVIPATTPSGWRIE